MRTGADLTMIEGLSQMSPSTGASVLNASYRTGDASSLLPIDAIQEFNTEQNPKAEYGWEPGSVINVGVKSGTNGLHGAAYAFGRDAQATDAANYFSRPIVSRSDAGNAGAIRRNGRRTDYQGQALLVCRL